MRSSAAARPAPQPAADPPIAAGQWPARWQPVESGRGDSPRKSPAAAAPAPAPPPPRMPAADPRASETSFGSRYSEAGPDPMDSMAESDQGPREEEIRQAAPPPPRGRGRLGASAARPGRATPSEAGSARGSGRWDAPQPLEGPPIPPAGLTPLAADPAAGGGAAGAAEGSCMAVVTLDRPLEEVPLPPTPRPPRACP
jgi:hypothetical protein